MVVVLFVLPLGFDQQQLHLGTTYTLVKHGSYFNS
jgi:hypothetical protein